MSERQLLLIWGPVRGPYFTSVGKKHPGSSCVSLNPIKQNVYPDKAFVSIHISKTIGISTCKNSTSPIGIHEFIISKKSVSYSIWIPFLDVV